MRALSPRFATIALAAPLFVTTTGLLDVRPSMSNLGSIFGHMLLWCGSMALAAAALQFATRFRAKPAIEDRYTAAVEEIEAETHPPSTPKPP